MHCSKSYLIITELNSLLHKYAYKSTNHSITAMTYKGITNMQLNTSNNHSMKSINSQRHAYAK